MKMAIAAVSAATAQICVSCVRQRQNRRRCIAASVEVSASAAGAGAAGRGAILQIYSVALLLALLAAMAQTAAVPFGKLKESVII